MKPNPKRTNLPNKLWFFLIILLSVSLLVAVNFFLLKNNNKLPPNTTKQFDNNEDLPSSQEPRPIDYKQNMIIPKDSDQTVSDSQSRQDLIEREYTKNKKNEVKSVEGKSTNNKQGVCHRPQKASINKNKIVKVPFSTWLKNFESEARGYGISDEILDNAFQGVYPIQKVIEFDRRQSEYSMTFSKYLRNSISAKRISTGKKMLNKYRKTLNSIEHKYGVQPQFLIAFWAMESDFGNNMGSFSTISTLATLAHEGRRSNFFHDELLCALQIIKNGHVKAKQMKSSWAGAMGQPQFMPSTFFHFGVDGNSDGKLNIWNNVADVFASSANYLNSEGWQAKETWGMEVKLPIGFDPYHAKFSEEKTIQEWQNLGVKKANGSKLPSNKITKGAIILPSGIKGPVFLIFQNFRVIRKWNRSINYALAVSHLADRLIGKGKLIAKGPIGEKPLSRKQAITLQSNLKELGFYTDNIDGMIGLKTREAIREYQRIKNIPADAYPSPSLINHAQNDVNNM